MHKYTCIKWIIIYWAVSLWNFAEGNDEKKTIVFACRLYWHFCVGNFHSVNSPKNTETDSSMLLLLDVHIRKYVCCLCWFPFLQRQQAKIWKCSKKNIPIALRACMCLSCRWIDFFYFKSISPSICLSVYISCLSFSLFVCLFYHFYTYHSYE